MASIKVIYHPEFEPPHDWLRRTLLFFDSVSVIVPKNASVKLTDDLSDLLKRLPHCVNPLQPNEGETYVDKENIELLARVFSEYKTPSTRRVEFDFNGDSLGLKGYGLFHRDKFSGEVVRLLEEKKLLNRPLSDAIDELTGGFLTIDDQAGNTLIAGLARRMAEKRGMVTISDRPLDYIFASRCSVENVDVRSTKTELASVIIRSQVPKSVDSISTSEYLKIRDRYKGIRELFQDYINDAEQSMNIGPGIDPDAAHGKFVEQSMRFSIAAEAERKRSLEADIRNYTYFGLGAVGAISVRVLGGLDPSLATAITAGTIGIGFTKLMFDGSTQPARHAGLYKSMVSLRGDLDGGLLERILRR